MNAAAPNTPPDRFKNWRHRVQISRPGWLLTPILALFIASHGLSQTNTTPSALNANDYSSYSRVITQENIFDPNRYPHETRQYHHVAHVSGTSSPAFYLVGIMSYSKGRFAFFSGNSDDLKKVITVSGSIAGYTVRTVTLDGVALQPPDGKSMIHLALGDGLRHDNNGWQPSEAQDMPVQSDNTPAQISSDGNGSAVQVPPPSTSLDNNDILKRLMLLRQKESQ